jgi:hypothetical protein
MSFVWEMWIGWAIIVLVTFALYLYRSRLTSDEDDQIYLDDAFAQEKAEQEMIAAKVAKIDPPLRILEWVAAAATVFVIVYYILDIIRHF